MEKEIFEKSYLERLNQNFEARSKYFDFKLWVLTDLGPIIFEVNNCLILGFDRASITLINFLLERGLKLALIYNEAGIGSKPVETWTDTFAGPSKKYNTFNLSTSIDRCKKEGLLNQNERDHLYDNIRVLLRNGFSHADPSEIMKNIPETPVFVGRFDNPGEIQKVNLDQKVIPTFQSLYMENFAKEIAPKYFDFVYNLVLNIDGRLKSRRKT